MSKLYIILFMIVAIYLLYKMKTKKPKEQRNQSQRRDFSDIATEFLFYELINQKPISLPPVNPMRQRPNNQVQQTQQHKRQQTLSSYQEYQRGADDHQKNKSKRKQWGVRVRNKIARSQNWRCAICKELLPELFHLDHIIPLCNNGKDELQNLEILCPNCHGSKTNDEGIKFGF